ncbi:UNVERIFIED_CONTAM: hypothetical protein PYX00_006631 [Menopon gallinae]|uniref:N-acetylglucosamine-6-phosphate deacetylase n=1 Tax=Menopon gallinae TaxID=328185 RepID=A0AAW2HXV5_9NEOP
MKLKDSSNTLTQFKNCYILRNHQIIQEDLWVRNGKFVNPENIFFDERNFADKQIDCQGALICPGFIDIQINGGFGVDFSQDITDVDVEKVSKGILAHGVTAFCPTLVTSPEEIYTMVLPHIKRREGGQHGATILGAHVEGPFISPQKKGAHPVDHMKSLEKGIESLLGVYKSLENISIITLAPEINGALDVIEYLSKKGIVVSLGHSVANLDESEAAVNKGATLITHLFNAMLPFHHRDPGLVGLLASESLPRRVYFGIISDGVHTHPSALRIAHRTHPKGLILVTDAVSALGLEEGTHRIGQEMVDIKNGRAVVSGTNTLCGSIATMAASVKYFRKATSCTIVEALEAATLHPAEALNITDRKGTLNFGADADFILLTPELDLISTWIAGECVYEAKR